MQVFQYFHTQTTQLCENFAIKPFKSRRCDDFFTFAKHSGTRQTNKVIRENICWNSRCYKALHNYLSRLVNKNKEKILKSERS